mgnify:CR=1 FL=1
MVKKSSVNRGIAVLASSVLFGVGLHAQIAVADTLEPVQDPPVVTFGDIKEVDITDDEGAVDWGSESYTRTSVTALTPGKMVDDENGDSTALDRAVYEVDVEVESNGALNSIQIVSLCLVEDTNNDLINTDLTIGNQSGLDDRCGYAETAPTTGISTDDLNPSITFAATYIGTDDDSDVTNGFETYEFALEDAGSHEHGLENEADGIADDSVVDDDAVPADKTRTVTFRFDLSHAATNSTKWYLRAVAVTQPPYTGAGDEASKQWTQAISGPLTVNYFGGITSTRTDAAGTNDRDVGVDYGPLTVDASKTVEDITTGTYLANDTSNITLKGSNFDYNSGDDTLTLGESADNSGVVDLRCVPSEAERATTDTNAALDDVSAGNTAGAMFVETTAKDLLNDVNGSNTNDDPENATAANTHDCRLTYGGGAKYGNQEYSNTVTVGIYDADAGSAGDADEDFGDGSTLTPAT